VTSYLPKLAFLANEQYNGLDKLIYYVGWLVVFQLTELKESANMSIPVEEIGKPEYKIPVKDINIPYHLNDNYSYCIIDFDESGIYSEDKATRKKVKHAFATLRKAFHSYRHSSQERYSENWRYSVTGSCWHFPQSTLLHFADWMEFTAPLETLLELAQERVRKARMEEEQQYRTEAEWTAWLNGFGRKPSDPVAESLRLFHLNTNATWDDVKRQYRQLAKRYHPDTGGDPGEFIRINSAYQVLQVWKGVA
jgi:DnaJ-domain-containing protein 1